MNQAEDMRRGYPIRTLLAYLRYVEYFYRLLNDKTWGCRMRAENKLLEPDTYNEVAGKVVVNV